MRARRGVAGTAVMLLAAPIPFAVSAHAAQGDIWTTGGGGLMTTQSNVVVQSGDGGPAVQATMVQPWGVVVATDGTTFVADVSANTIRAIYPDGTIDTVAGTTAGFSGDGGPATLAQLWGPRDVDVDPAGGLIISDTENNRLRKVWPDGSITTIAGGYQQPPNLIGDGGPLLEATLRQPSGVVFAPDGEMFIREGTRIRRVDLSGTITTFAYGLVASGDLDVDSAGNLYVPDGDVIWKFDTSGSKTIFAGRGGLPGSTMDGVPATDAEVGTYHVTVAPNDDVYFTDGSGRVRRVSSGIVTTIAGGGTEPDATGCLRATLAHHLYAQGLDVDSHGDVVVAMNNLVRTIALTDSTCPSITAFTPQRVLETRLADGQIGYSGARPTPGQTVVLDLSTSGSGVPADATAASLNLTITNAVHDGYVTAWPCEAAQPITSNINVTIGATAANAVLVTLGPSNKVCLFDQAGGDLIVDVTGYVGANVPYQPLVPYRALETRPTEAMWQYHGPKPVAGQVVHVPITGWGYGDNSVSAYATAVVLNVTATDATADGYVTVWSCEGSPPTASNINVTRGGTVAHMVVVRLGRAQSQFGGISGEICLFTQSGTHLVVDILGAFMPDSPYVGVAPKRILETRLADGQVGYSGSRPAAGQIVPLDVVGLSGGVVPSSARAIVLNVTATNPGGAGFVTVWPCGGQRPVASTLNLAVGDTQANAVVVGLGASGMICLFTQSGADLIADLNGYFA